jgi:hypothetical protein
VPAGPRRLRPSQILGYIYPCLFAAIYWVNERHSGRQGALEKGVGFLVFATWVPSLLFVLQTALGGEPIEGLEPLYWIFTVASLAAVWRLHRTLLLTRGIGLRFLRRYPRLDPVDQLWIKAATVAAFAIYLAGVGLQIRQMPVPRTQEVIATDFNLIANAAHRH